MKRVVVAVTGASGSVYGQRLIERLLAAQVGVELVVSDAGRRVAREETERSFDQTGLAAWLGPLASNVTLHPVTDIGAPIASGSYPTAGMLIVPCSMGTAARVAAGLSSNLVERAADVHLKERRPLVVVPREAPLSVLHLENLLKLARVGAVVLPAAPGFYARPTGIDELVDFVVDRAARAVGVEFGGAVRWTGGAARPQA